MEAGALVEDSVYARMRRYEKKVNKMQMTIVVLLVVGLSSNIYSWNYRYEEGFGIGYTDGSEDGYNLGYTDGSEDGFETGYDEGEFDGFNIGFDSGNETGYAHGKSDGYFDGYSVGETSGYSEGFTWGRDDGLAEGYQDGYIKGNTDGYANGGIDGYEKGYFDGYDAGQWAGYDAGLIDSAEKHAVGEYEGEYWFLRNPTEQEMWTFINADRTDRRTWVDGEFTCVNFAATVKRNAFYAGYRCFSVYIFMVDGGHDLVGFNTTDSGLMFIEPQHDRMMKVEVGIKYWDRKYYAPTYDDTILRYVLVP